MPWLQEIRSSLELFSPTERNDIVIYILGLMIFKFGTEAYNGSMIALASNRYDLHAEVTGDSTVTFQRIGLLQCLNLGIRCLGSVLVGPLVARFQTKHVLGGACLFLGLSTAVLMIIDSAHGGSFKIDDFEVIGNFNPDFLIPIHAAYGVGNGMTDLVRAIIPSDMVGGHSQKLQKMDALVHFFFNLAAIIGSLSTALYFIPLLGHNRAFLVTPICCGVSTFLFSFLSKMGFERLKYKSESGGGKKKNIFWELGKGFWLFMRSIGLGAQIVFTHRDLIWLVPCYGMGSYAHRYLDTGLLPKLAKRYLGHAS